MRESKKLTRLQRRWCERVNAGENGTQVLREMRPNLKEPRHAAYEYRQMPHIQAYLGELDARATEHAGVTRTFVLTQLKAVAGFDPRKLYNADGALKRIDEIDEETAAALASIEVEEILEGSNETPTRRRTKKVRHWSKTEALRLLAQILGMTKEQTVLTPDLASAMRDLAEKLPV